MRNPTQDFMWCVQALAQPPEIQMSLFPSFVLVADELALDFEEHLKAVAPHRESWSAAQRHAVMALDQLLLEMSGPDKPEVWERDRCLYHSQWSAVRHLAEAALEVFGWPNQPPPLRRAIYVGPPGTR